MFVIMKRGANAKSVEDGRSHQNAQHDTSDESRVDEEAVASFLVKDAVVGQRCVGESVE